MTENKKVEIEMCKMCDKNKANTKHHIIPKMFRKVEMVSVCQTCHYSVNDYFSNYELYKLALKGVYPTTKKFQKLFDSRVKEVNNMLEGEKNGKENNKTNN